MAGNTGLITSTQRAEGLALNQLTTGTLTGSDIQNHADYKGSSVGISGSGGFNAD